MGKQMRDSIIRSAVLLLLFTSTATAELKVGAAAIDVSPKQFPVIINGGMLTRNAEQLTAPIKARAIVLDLSLIHI